MFNFINVAYAHSGEFGGGSDMHDLGMMSGAGSILWIIMWLSIFALVILGIIALSKYVFGKEKNDKEYHICPECGFEYGEKEWAKKCQEWCSEHKSCNLEITKHSRQNKNSKK